MLVLWNLIKICQLYIFVFAVSICLKVKFDARLVIMSTNFGHNSIMQLK